MARPKRTVADRQKSLLPRLPKANFTVAFAKRAYSGLGGKEYPCTIGGHCRTQVFQFPGIDFHPDGDEPHHSIYASPSVRACLTSDPLDYFADAKNSRQYGIDPGLRHLIHETVERISRQQSGRVPVFLVVEEYNELTPTQMTNGECCILDEVEIQNGEREPVLIGGREGEQFVTAWATIDGAWPELPSNQQFVNLILVAVRVAQRTPEPIPKYVDQSCLLTTEGRFVVMNRPTASGRLGISTPMDSKAYRGRVSQIREAIAAMEPDVAKPHMALLINSMYSDEYKDDAYQRLQYLRLWQSLADTVRTCFGYKGNITEDNTVLSGKKSLRELTEYRHDIAHWWTDTIDESYLADLQRTLNELVHRKYFQSQ